MNVLLFLHLAHVRDLIPGLRGTFELQLLGSLFHRPFEIFEDGIVPTVEKHHRMAHIICISLRFDQPDARRRATSDLVL